MKIIPEIPLTRRNRHEKFIIRPAYILLVFLLIRTRSL